MDSGRSESTRSKDRQESAMACRSTTGTPEGSPCSTYGSLTRLGSSTDLILGVVVLFIVSLCAKAAGHDSLLPPRLSLFPAGVSTHPTPPRRPDGRPFRSRYRLLHARKCVCRQATCSR